MSNSRIFCWTWMICNAATGVYSLLGFPEKYSGIEGMIAQFILSTTVAISMVAVAGDQKAKP